MSLRATRSRVWADRIAPSTMARLITFLCTSPYGTLPLRSAATNSAKEPAIPSGPVPTTAAIGVPSALSAIGAWSPSQSAVPSAPLIRQLPFHDVSRPGLHQLPLNTNRVPSANSAFASAAASPAYQLQLGLNDSQEIDTGSLPIRSRARSN